MRSFNSGRASRSGRSRYGDPIACPALPESCVPATVEQHGFYLHLSGSYNIYHPPVSVSHGFFDFIRTQLPASASWTLQHFHFVGNFHRLQTQMTSLPVVLCAVSDGSYKSSHGTASWRISVVDSEDYFLGSLVTPGPSDCQSAYRSELAGLYGIALSLWSLKQFFKCNITVTIACDGLSALRQYTYLSDVVNPNVPHFDLVSATRWVLQEVQGMYHWKHVSGHQDDDSEALLDKWATWNIQMDLAAKDFWTQTHLVDDENRNMHIFGEVGSVWIQGHKVVQDFKKQLLEYLGSIDSVPKWEAKFNWTKGSGSTVNWKFFGVANKSVPAARRLWVTKTASGFFASGKMMKLRRERPDAQCPRCAFDPEDRLHILQCSHPEAGILWDQSMLKLEAHLVSVDTEVTVAKTIYWKLQEWRSAGSLAPLAAQYPIAFREAFQAQDELGWEAFLFGMWTVEF